MESRLFGRARLCGACASDPAGKVECAQNHGRDSLPGVSRVAEEKEAGKRRNGARGCRECSAAEVSRRLAEGLPRGG